MDKTYEYAALPAFFANRVMSTRRVNYAEYLDWLCMEAPADPMEVLVRTGGPRATDTFHVVDDLAVAPGGHVVSRFFPSGIRHIDGAHGRLELLAPGQELSIRDESGNPVNPRAMLLDHTHAEPVGYIPDWLVEDVHALRSLGATVRVYAERGNSAAPSHLQLLCRLEGELSP